MQQVEGAAGQVHGLHFTKLCRDLDAAQVDVVAALSFFSTSPASAVLSDALRWLHSIEVLNVICEKRSPRSLRVAKIMLEAQDCIIVVGQMVAEVDQVQAVSTGLQHASKIRDLFAQELCVGRVPIRSH